MLKKTFILTLYILSYKTFFSSFFKDNLEKAKSTVTTKFQNEYNNQVQKLDKFNPFTPDKAGILLKNCDYKFNPKKLFPQLPVEDMVCRPRHVEFGRKKIGAFAIWIFFCDYKSKLLDSEIILRINANLSMGQMTSLNTDYLKDDKNFTWLIGTDRTFLLANLLESDSLRCNQVKRILSTV